MRLFILERVALIADYSYWRYFSGDEIKRSVTGKRSRRDLVLLFGSEIVVGSSECFKWLRVFLGLK